MVSCLFQIPRRVTLGVYKSTCSLLQQSQPDITGTWALDMSRPEASDPKQSKNALYDAMTIVITYRDPELRITRRLTKNGKERQQTHLLHRRSG